MMVSGARKSNESAQMSAHAPRARLRAFCAVCWLPLSCTCQCECGVCETDHKV